MSTIDLLAKEFLSQQCIAVAGVSAARDTPANLIYRKLRDRGIRVYAVNPKRTAIASERCYPDLWALPEKPDGVVIVIRPSVADAIVRQCIDLGIRRVWMHSMLGTRPRLLKRQAEAITSVSEEGVRLCHAYGISVIPGSCPMQFLGDAAHTCMRGLLRVTGALEIPA